jgi:hypothetical protein
MAFGMYAMGLETTDGGNNWSEFLTGIDRREEVLGVAYDALSTRTVIAGSSSKILSNTTGLPVQEVPVLNTPPNDSAFSSTPVTLEWSPLMFVSSYTVQVSLDSEFVAPEIVSVLRSNTYQFQPAVNGIFFWRVCTTNSAGNGPWSETRRFVVSVPLPTVPSVLTPADGETLLTDAVLASWKKTEGAHTYSLEIARDESFADLIAGIGGIADTFLLYDSLQNNAYYWRVRGSNIGGQGPWSEVRTFQIALPVPTPVDLVSPPDSATILVVAWRFLWSRPSPEVSRFQFELATDQSFSVNLVDSSLTDTSISINYIQLDKDYWWRVRAENLAGWGPFAVHRFWTYEVEVPRLFVLEQNFPNPFNGSSLIRFGVPYDATVSVVIFDVLGKKVRTLFSGSVVKGFHEISIEAKHYASGVYWCEMATEGFRDRKKIIVLK